MAGLYAWWGFSNVVRDVSGPNGQDLASQLQRRLTRPMAEAASRGLEIHLFVPPEDLWQRVYVVVGEPIGEIGGMESGQLAVLTSDRVPESRQRAVERIQADVLALVQGQPAFTVEPSTFGVMVHQGPQA